MGGPTQTKKTMESLMISELAPSPPNSDINVTVGAWRWAGPPRE